MRWYRQMKWEFTDWFRYISYYSVLAHLKQENGLRFIIENTMEKKQNSQSKT